MVLGKKVAIFDWEWGRNLAPKDRQKIPCKVFIMLNIASPVFIQLHGYSKAIIDPL